MSVERWPSFLVNLDFCGTCHGTCRGCLLQEDERKTVEAFLSFSQISTAFQQLKTKQPHAFEPDYAALAFGRGNTLALSNSTWRTMKESATLFQSLFAPRQLTVECSTGLIGKIQPLVDTAKRRIDEWGPSLRFVVAANSDLYSQSYWDNVDVFFEALMTHRGGNTTEESGDVLVLNLVADRLPDVVHLVSRLKRYPFPVNIAWLPLSSSSNATTHLSAHRWLNEFHRLMKAGEWDSNFSRFFDATQLNVERNDDSMAEAMEHLSVNLQRFWWVEKTGHLSPGLFTPMGDVDFLRFEQKLGIAPLPKTPARIFRSLQSRGSCRECDYQATCLKSGVALHAIASTETSVCPLGVRAIQPKI